MAQTHEETDVPSHAKEAPIVENDVVKENGELPASEDHVGIVGKEKEDSTLKSNSPAPEITHIPAPVENGGGHAIPSEGAKEDEKADTEAIAAAPDAQRSEEGAPQFGGGEHAIPTEAVVEEERTGTEKIADTAPSADAPQANETNKEAAGTEQPEKTPVVDTSKTKEPETQVGEAEAPKSSGTEEREKVAVDEAPKNIEDATHEEVLTPAPEIGKKEAETVGQQETFKPEEKADDASEVAGEGTPRSAFAANAGEPILTEAKQAEEPKNVDETIHEVGTLEEQPPAEVEEPAQPKSFWGVVLKHVEPYLKSPLESHPKEEDSTDGPSHAVDKSPEEGHKQEPIAEQEIASENATTPKETGLPTSELEEKEILSSASETSKEIPESASQETAPELSERSAESTEEPEQISTTTIPDQEPVSAGQDTTEHLTQETPKEATSDEESLPVKEDAVEEKEAGDGGSALEKQPSLSVFIPKQGEPAAVEEKETGDVGSALEKQPSLSVFIPKQGEPAAASEGNTAEVTTPRGTPLLQRVEDLEQKLVQLESRQSPRSDFASTGQSTRSSIDRPIKHSARHVLEETGSKGTLLDRVSALEQKLSYHLNVDHTSPSNDQSTPPIAEDLASEPESKPPESQTRDWSPSAVESDKTPERVNEETSKSAQDPIKPTTDEKSPEDLPDHTSPSNDQSTPPIAEDLASEPESNPPESQTRDWSPSAAESDKPPERVNEETSKPVQDPIKPTTDEKSPEDLPDHTSPSNDQSTPPIAEDLASEPESKLNESQTRDWSRSAAESDKIPERVNEETSKSAQDPIKPTTDEKSPEDLPAQKEGVTSFRSTSIKKVKAKAVGQIKGFITGCFSPKKGKPVSTSS